MKRSPRQTRLDLYLTRASHGAQIVLVIVAVFGYIYTVLPIYQKELLSEEIARRTIQLEGVREQLKSAESERSELTHRVGELRQQGESLSMDIGVKEARLGAVTEALARTHYIIFLERVEFLTGIEYVYFNGAEKRWDALKSGDHKLLEASFLSPYSAIMKALATINEASLETPGAISQKKIDTYRANLLKVVEKNKTELSAYSGNAKDIVASYLSEMEKNNEAQWKIKEKYWKVVSDSTRKDSKRAMEFIREQKRLK